MPVKNLAESLRIKGLNVRFPFIIGKRKKRKKRRDFIVKPGRIIFK